MKAWTLVVTDGSYIEVACFFGELPTVEAMYSKIDFQKCDILDALLDVIKANTLSALAAKKGDTDVQFYVEGNKTYMFHFRAHEPREQGYILVES